MLSKLSAELALAESLRSGGDFAELFYEDTRSGSISLTDGKTDKAALTRLHGAGLRVYYGLQSVYVHTCDTTEEGLMKLARQAADAVGQAAKDASVRLTRSVAANIHPIALQPLDVSGGKKQALLHGIYKAAKDYSPDIKQVTAALTARETEVTIANSEGLFVGDTRTYSRAMISTVASDGTVNQTGGNSPGAMKGFEFFTDCVDLEAEARDAARCAVTMLHASECPAGVMPVVIGNGFGGVIFHEACGHSLEATSVAMGNSEFCGKLGTQIATPIVTAIDDGTIPGKWGSLNIDDEGTPTQKLTLIENGILKNYMIDRMGSRRMNMPVTGSSRRQDYTFCPTSRMRNTYIAAGNDDMEEIIRTCGDGLYAARMGGGSVNPSTGEFNFSVREGYLIRDGKIAEPVRGATLIGRGSEILTRIDRVGKDLELAEGVCGSLSGSVNTTVGQPMIRVTAITVGGRKGGK